MQTGSLLGDEHVLEPDSSGVCIAFIINILNATGLPALKG